MSWGDIAHKEEESLVSLLNRCITLLWKNSMFNYVHRENCWKLVICLTWCFQLFPLVLVLHTYPFLLLQGMEHHSNVYIFKYRFIQISINLNRAWAKSLSYKRLEVNLIISDQTLYAIKHTKSDQKLSSCF